MSRPIPEAASRRRRILITLAILLAAFLGAGAWFLFNGLPLPVMAADRARVLTARDLEPLIPGFSALEGTESFKKRLCFARIEFFQPLRGTETNYEFESKPPRVWIICKTMVGSTEEDAESFLNCGIAVYSLLGLFSFFGPFSMTERDDFLAWGDASRCYSSVKGDVSNFSFMARKGKRVFILFLGGPRLDDDGLRKTLLPRLEALATG